MTELTGPSGRARPAPDQAPPAVRPGAGGRARAAVRAAARRARAAAEPRRLPGRVRQVDAARRVAGAGAAHRPVAWVTLDEGDDDAVVLWSHVIEALCRACPGLPHAGARGLAATAPLLEVVLPRLVNSSPSWRRRARARRLPPALEPDGARERRVVRRPRCPRRCSWCSPRAPTRRSRSARCAPTASWSSCAPTSCASRRRGRRVPQRRGWSSGSPPPTSSCSSPAPRAGRPASTSRRSRWPARPTSTALVAAFDGTSAHVVDFLSSEVLAGLRAGAAGVHAAHVGARAAVRAAVRRGRSTRRLRGGARRRSRAPTCSCSRSTTAARWFRFHHLFAQLLRVELERREPGARARCCTAARSRGTASRARPTRRSTTRVAAGAFAEAGALIAETWVHYVNAGPDLVGARLARSASRAAVLAADRRLLLVQAWLVRAARARGTTCARAVARVRELGGLDEGPLPGRLRLARVQPHRAAARVRLGRRRRRCSRTARARPSSKGPESPWRPVVTWSLGWAHYCNGELDDAERWLSETAALAPADRPVDRRRRRRSPTCR